MTISGLILFLGFFLLVFFGFLILGKYLPPYILGIFKNRDLPRKYRKNFFSIIFLIGLFWTFPVFAQDVGDQIITNGGFESDFFHWDTTFTQDAIATTTISEYYEGNKSFVCEISLTNVDYNCVLIQDIGYVLGPKYLFEFDFWAKLSSSTLNANIRYNFTNDNFLSASQCWDFINNEAIAMVPGDIEDNCHVDINTLTENWQNFSNTLKGFDNETLYLNFIITGETDQNIFLDDVSLEIIGFTESQTVNEEVIIQNKIIITFLMMLFGIALLDFIRRLFVPLNKKRYEY